MVNIVSGVVMSMGDDGASNKKNAFVSGGGDVYMGCEGAG